MEERMSIAMHKKKHTFLIAPPRTGKSTLINKVLAASLLAAGGFRTYFGSDADSQNKSLYLKRADLPDAFDEAHTVARFREGMPPSPDIDAFNRAAGETIKTAGAWADVLIFDECSFLESSAQTFTEAILNALNEDIPVLGVLRHFEGSWNDGIFHHPDVRLIDVTTGNRNALAETLSEEYRKLRTPRKQNDSRMVLMRHCEPAYSSTVPRFTGKRDIPLAKSGRQHAAAIAKELHSYDFDLVLSGTLSRSFDTAAIAAEELGLAHAADERLNEIDLGSWEDKPIGEVRQTHPDEYRLRGEEILTYRIPGAETFMEVAERAQLVLSEYENSGKRVLAVTHAGVLKSLFFLRKRIEKKDFSSFSIPFGFLCAI